MIEKHFQIGLLTLQENTQTLSGRIQAGTAFSHSGEVGEVPATPDLCLIMLHFIESPSERLSSKLHSDTSASPAPLFFSSFLPFYFKKLHQQCMLSVEQIKFREVNRQERKAKISLIPNTAKFLWIFSINRYLI